MRFLLFISLFLLVYGGMHLYLYRHLVAGLPTLRRYRLPLWSLLLVMVVMPITVRVVESYGYHDSARSLALVGFFWMGWLLLFCFYAAVADLLGTAGRVLRGEHLLSPGRRLAAAVTLALLSSLYGIFEARQMNVERVAVVDERVTSSRPYRLVQLTDVHVGLMTRTDWLQQVVDTTNGLEADLIVVTGDLIDANVDGTEEYVPLLRQLHAREGVYGVTGNHEYIAGIEKSIDFFARGGIELLRDENLTVNDWLTLIGIDDPGRHSGEQREGADEAGLLATVPSSHYRLLLKHRPLIAEGTVGRFDLQLSGHTHKGQIFPFVVLPWLAYGSVAGLYDVGEGSRLYVGRGTGTWGPPIRFLAPPEITLFEFSRR